MKREIWIGKETVADIKITAPLNFVKHYDQDVLLQSINSRLAIKKGMRKMRLDRKTYIFFKQCIAIGSSQQVNIRLLIFTFCKKSSPSDIARPTWIFVRVEFLHRYIQPTDKVRLRINQILIRAIQSLYRRRSLIKRTGWWNYCLAMLYDYTRHTDNIFSGARQPFFSASSTARSLSYFVYE